MSSRNQYKEWLKREKTKNQDLQNEVIRLSQANRVLRQLNHELKNQLAGMPRKSKLKKWWQFWKRT